MVATTPAAKTEEREKPNSLPLAPDVAPSVSLPALRLFLEDLSLYETKTRYYIVGTDRLRSAYRVLQLDRESGDTLEMREDCTRYSENQKDRLLQTIGHGFSNVGGMRKVTHASVHGRGLAGRAR